MSHSRAEDEPLHVVAAVIAAETPGSALVFQRAARRHHGGRWEFPGGKVEAGETEPEALAREIAEELGVRCAVGEHLWTGRADGPPPVSVSFYRVRLAAEPMVLRDHDAVRSFAFADPEDLPWAPVDGDFVRWYAAAHKAEIPGPGGIGSLV